jgi:glycosyltransferase involved in cell wall biosynthesis
MKKLLYIVEKIGVHERRFYDAMRENFDLEILALNETPDFRENFKIASKNAELIVAGPLGDPITKIPVENQIPIFGICYASEINETYNFKEIQANIDRCAAIITDSAYVSKKLQLNFDYKNPVYETKYGCDWPNFSQYEPKFQAEPSIIVLRSWNDLYRNEIILDSLFELHKIGIDFTCTFIGMGPNLESGKILAKKYGIEDKVFFLGSVENSSLPALMSQHWIYLSAARSDGTSVSLLEALSMGMICLTSDFPTNWFLEKENIGRNFESGNKKDLVEKILQIESFSREEKTRMSSEAREYGKNEGRWSENSKVFLRAINQTLKP